MDAESSAPDLARAFHRAVTTENWDLLRDILDPAVTWSFPGSNILSGMVRGSTVLSAKRSALAVSVCRSHWSTS